MKKPGGSPGGDKNQQGMLGKDLKEVTATACAAVVGDSSTVSSMGRNLGGSIAEKLHGLSERIHQLGHSRHDSSGGDSGKRSRAGTHTHAQSAHVHHAKHAHHWWIQVEPNVMVMSLAKYALCIAQNNKLKAWLPFVAQTVNPSIVKYLNP